MKRLLAFTSETAVSRLQMKHILLLNPPGNHIYLREYFCGKISKADYLIHPVDLLWLSGQLGSRYRVTILDAIAENLSREQTISRLAAEKPDALIVLSSSVSAKEDLEFIRLIRKQIPEELVAIGDNFFSDPVKSLEDHPELDALLLGFLQPTLADYFAGERETGLTDIVFRHQDRIIETEPDASSKPFCIGLPRHDQLNLKKYNFPFAKWRPFGTLLTDYGCPYRCSFCLIGSLHYRTRQLDDVFNELAYLKSLGVRDLYIDDQTFMPSSKRLSDFCDRLRDQNTGLGWTCYIRADLSNEERLRQMKEAGCHTVIIGVESGNDDILARYGKEVTTAQIAEAIKRARGLGLSTVGTFIIGLPGETAATCEKTIRFALDVDLDFASFNTPIPRAYTHMREEVLSEGWGVTGDQPDQSGLSAAVNTPQLTAEQAYRYRNLAERSFYLRPAYLLRRLLKLRTPSQAYLTFREGFSLLRRIRRRLRHPWSDASGIH